MKEWINNDTIAVVGLILLGLGGIVTKNETITSVTVGAIGGYIGSKAMNPKE